MPETYEQMVNRILRDHEGYTGDGRGGNGALPVGDRSTARKPLDKRDLRSLFLSADFAASAAAVTEALGASYSFSTLDALLASTSTFPTGTVLTVRGDGSSFEVVASGGDHTTAGGLQLRRRHRPIMSVETIAALKALPAARLGAGDLCTVHGFDTAGDGCGGIFRYHSGPAPSAVLNGVIMAASGGGYWQRTDYSGRIHTRWCGIKPEAAPGATYNASGFGANNRTRWQAMSAWCGAELMTFPLLTGKAGIVRGAVYVDAGVHDFIGGGINLPDCVGLTGAGRGAAALRADIAGGVFLSIGTVGDFTTTPAVESAFADFNSVSVLSHTDVTGGTGVRFSNTFRATNIREIFVRGFGKNLHVDAFGANISNVWLQSGYTNNLHIGPRCNSADIHAGRFDDQRLGSATDNVLVEESGYARGIKFDRCDIQRSYGRALRFVNVAQASVRDCFFEGNNRADMGNPDIWIEGVGVQNFLIDSCYFTGTGRFGGTTSRAINIRDSVTASARFQISNCDQADGPQGSFANFIDVDANVALEVAAWNNRHTAVNSIPANVVKRGLAAGTWS